MTEAESRDYRKQSIKIILVIVAGLLTGLIIGWHFSSLRSGCFMGLGTGIIVSAFLKAPKSFLAGSLLPDRWDRASIILVGIFFIVLGISVFFNPWIPSI